MTFANVFCIAFVVLLVVGGVIWAWQDGPVDESSKQSGWDV